MVERHESDATVVDLDGTLFNVNTLHLYIKTALAHHARAWRFGAVALVSFWCALRLMRMISHKKMKQKVLQDSIISNDLLDEFRAKAFRHVNPKVADMIRQDYSQGNTILLATAAADNYVFCLWDGDYIASDIRGPELMREEKLRRTKRWLSDHHARLKKVITDHHDDLPLAQYADSHGAEVLLVNPSRCTHRRFSKSGIHYEVI